VGRLDPRAGANNLIRMISLYRHHQMHYQLRCQVEPEPKEDLVDLVLAWCLNISPNVKHIKKDASKLSTGQSLPPVYATTIQPVSGLREPGPSPPSPLFQRTLGCNAKTKRVPLSSTKFPTERERSSTKKNSMFAANWPSTWGSSCQTGTCVFGMSVLFFLFSTKKEAEKCSG
jgi:hypothetical protein